MSKIIDFKKAAERNNVKFDETLFDPNIADDEFLLYLVSAAFEEMNMDITKENIITIRHQMDLDDTPIINSDFILGLLPLLTYDNRVSVINHLTSIKNRLVDEQNKNKKKVKSPTNKYSLGATIFAWFLLFMIIYGFVNFILDIPVIISKLTR